MLAGPLPPGRGRHAWYGCDCKVHPPQLRLTGRAARRLHRPGSTCDRRSGSGLVAGLERDPRTGPGFFGGPLVDFRHRPVVRPGGGRRAWILPDRRRPDPLDLARLEHTHGQDQVREARLQGGSWTLDAPRAVAGVTWGRWSLSAGWAPRRTGPADRGPGPGPTGDPFRP